MSVVLQRNIRNRRLLRKFQQPTETSTNSIQVWPSAMPKAQRTKQQNMVPLACYPCRCTQCCHLPGFLLQPCSSQLWGFGFQFAKNFARNTPKEGPNDFAKKGEPFGNHNQQCRPPLLLLLGERNLVASPSLLMPSLSYFPRG